MKVRGLFLAVSLGATLVGCGASEATFFRKHGATVKEERVDWGLCGGNFQPGGAVRPNFDPELLRCMQAKGYATINNYYVEDFVWWMHRTEEESI